MSKRTEFLTELICDNFNVNEIDYTYDEWDNEVEAGHVVEYEYNGEYYEDFDTMLEQIEKDDKELFDKVMEEFLDFEEENKKSVEQYKQWLKEIFDREQVEIFVSVNHVSDDGMVRFMSFATCSVIDNSEVKELNRKLATHNITYWMAEVLDWETNSNGDLVVGGCGMDMVFHALYTLSSKLYDGDGDRINPLRYNLL